MAQIKKQTSREMVQGEDNDEHPEINFQNQQNYLGVFFFFFFFFGVDNREKFY